MKKCPELVNAYRILLLVGVICRPSIGNALDNATTNQPSVIISDSTQSTPRAPDALASKSTENTDQSAYEQPIELKKAMYGIPLGVSLNDVQKWIDEKKVEIKCATEPEINDAYRSVLSRLNDVGLLQDTGLGQEEIGGEKKIDCKNLERQLRTITSNAGKAGVDEGPFIMALQKLCRTLRNPTIAYKGNTYFLDSVTQTFNDAFVLTVSPSDEMKENGVLRVKIFMWKKGDVLVSYGADVSLLYRQDVEKVVSTLDQKYGEFHMADAARSDELYRITGFPNVSPSNQRIRHPSDNQDIRQWRKNIVMTQLVDQNLGTTSEFIYYDASATKEIIDEQDVALREIEEKNKHEAQKQEQQQSDRMKDNF